MNAELEKLKASIVLQVKNLKPMLHAFVAKLKNYETNNYQLGLDQLKSGNLRDAQFRFWLVTQLNPNYPGAATKLAEVRKLRAAQKTKPS